jgi:hypothetical protein
MLYSTVESLLLRLFVILSDVEMSRLAHANGYAILNPDRSLEIYFIKVKAGRVALFATSDVIELFENESDDRIARMIGWLSNHRYRLVAWLGRVFHSARGYYVRLEARLDPVERVLKAMESAGSYVVLHSDSEDSALRRRQFFGYLRRQRAKHIFWFVVDLLLSIASLAIAWLPGPNVVGWYPFLRSISHFRAFSGTLSALRSNRVEFKGLPQLHRLEENLQAPGFDRKSIHGIVEDLRISGLEQFLERMV